MEERLHKLLAAAGVASRREAERMIAAGRVAVDGQVVTEMGVKVDPDQHTISVDGRPVAPSPRLVYVLLNKPRGYVTTRSDPHAQHVVMELLAEVPVPVHPVGRLDKDTEGALLFTNDGALTELLTHPRHAVPKVYVAHVKGVPGARALERLRTGVRLEDGMTAPAQVRVLGIQNENAALEVILREGRNRQVRRMLEAVGHPVEQLRRVAIGPVSIRKLPVGCWRHLSQKEVHALRKAAQTGAGPHASAEAAAEAAGASAETRARPARPASGPASRPSAPRSPERAAGAPPRPEGRTRRPSSRAGRPAGAKQQGARPTTGKPGGQPAARGKPQGAPGQAKPGRPRTRS